MTLSDDPVSWRCPDCGYPNQDTARCRDCGYDKRGEDALLDRLADKIAERVRRKKETWD